MVSGDTLNGEILCGCVGGIDGETTLIFFKLFISDFKLANGLVGGESRGPPN